MPKDLSNNIYTKVETNIENSITNANEKNATLDSNSKTRVSQQNKAKVADAIRQSTEANNVNNVSNLDTKAAENDEYVYRGPKNTTGIFKNSLILSDLTGFVHEPDKHPGLPK